MGLSESHKFLKSLKRNPFVNEDRHFDLLFVDLLWLITRFAFHTNPLDEDFCANVHSACMFDIETQKAKHSCSQVKLFVDSGPRIGLKKSRNKLPFNLTEIIKLFPDVIQADGEAEVRMVRDADEKTILYSNDSDLFHLCINRDVGAILRLCPSSDEYLLFDPRSLKENDAVSNELFRLFLILLGTDFTPTILTPKRFQKTLEVLDSKPDSSTSPLPLPPSTNKRRRSSCRPTDLKTTTQFLESLLSEKKLTNLLFEIVKLTRKSSKINVSQRDLWETRKIVTLIWWMYEYSRTLHIPDMRDVEHMNAINFPMVRFFPALKTLVSLQSHPPAPPSLKQCLPSQRRWSSPPPTTLVATSSIEPADS